MGCVRVLVAGGLTVSEALGVVRAARLWPGPVDAELPRVLEGLALLAEEEAGRLRGALAFVRATGGVG